MEPDAGTTNIRNTASKHWQRWMGRESRCVVLHQLLGKRSPAERRTAAGVVRAMTRAGS
jgi:putative SOS response-associated peptidase YedK